MKVLLAIDESAFSAEAARQVENRLKLPGIEVRVLHVVGTFIPPPAAIVEAIGFSGVRLWKSCVRIYRRTQQVPA
jgi:hypothetical protein